MSILTANTQLERFNLLAASVLSSNDQKPPSSSLSLAARRQSQAAHLKFHKTKTLCLKRAYLGTQTPVVCSGYAFNRSSAKNYADKSTKL
jgi:hypothetical protein